MESPPLIDQNSDWIESGPDWNPDKPPVKYAGAAIRWSTTYFDSVVIPLIVTTKQVFWGLRLDAFEITDHVLKIIIDLPSIHGPEMEVVSFKETDKAPGDVAREITRVLDAVGEQVLSESWRYEIVFRQGERSETLQGEIASGE